MACDRGLVAVGLWGGAIEIDENISGDREASDRDLVTFDFWDVGVDNRVIILVDRLHSWRRDFNVVRHRNVVSALVFTSDGRLVSGCHDGFVKKWDVETGAKVWSRDTGIGQVSFVSELADGRLVVGGSDCSVRVLDGVTGHEITACMDNYFQRVLARVREQHPDRTPLFGTGPQTSTASTGSPSRPSGRGPASTPTPC
jgi:WD40 repeat protein